MPEKATDKQIERTATLDAILTRSPVIPVLVVGEERRSRRSRWQCLRSLLGETPQSSSFCPGCQIREPHCPAGNCQATGSLAGQRWLRRCCGTHVMKDEEVGYHQLDCFGQVEHPAMPEFQLDLPHQVVRIPPAA